MRRRFQLAGQFVFAYCLLPKPMLKIKLLLIQTLTRGFRLRALFVQMILLLLASSINPHFALSGTTHKAHLFRAT